MIVKNNKDEFQSYLTDASNLQGNATELSIPESKIELQELIKNLYSKNIEFTISAGGTGTTGSKVPMGGVMISMEKLNKVIDFDMLNKTITLEAGYRLIDLQNLLKEHNLFLPPNPTETWSMIGGNISTNASGSRSFKYGSMRKFVLCLEILLPNGEIIKLDRTQNTINNNYLLQSVDNVYSFEFQESQLQKVKNASGYYLKPNMSLLDLFIGAEGTLGVITEITYQVIDLPQVRIGIVSFFEKDANMLNYVSNLRIDSKFKPTLIEYFDINCLNILKKEIPSLPENSISAIWIEIELTNEEIDQAIEYHFEKIQECTIYSDETMLLQTENEMAKFDAYRHSIPLFVNDFITKYGSRKLGTDSAVPSEYFSDYFEFIKSKLEASGLEFVVFGHIGDCHLHANILAKSQTEYDFGRAIYKEFMLKAIELQGTVSAEHGIGKLKREYLKLMLGEEIYTMHKSIKTLFDSKNLLNKGNLFD